MDALLAYILKSVAISAALSAYYYLFLRNRKYHRYNRYYLLSAVVISLLLPCLHFSWYTIREPQYIPAYLLDQQVPVELAGNPEMTTFSYYPLLVTASLCVSAALLVFLCLRIVWIYKLRNKFPGTRVEGVTLIETDIPQAPFSFLRNLFWQQDMPYRSGVGADIFRHELTHILQRHTYDKLFIQFVRCLFWVNPFFWLIQKELNMIHEFLADEGAIHHGDTESFALMLLRASSNGKQFVDPAHFFSHSPVKRRLAMIASTTPSRTWGKLLALPFIVTVIALSSISLGFAQSKNSESSAGKKDNLDNARITKIQISDKRPSGEKPGDSLLTMKVQVIRADGKRDTLVFKNVHYSENFSGPEQRLRELQEGLNAEEREAHMKSENEGEARRESQVNYADEVKASPNPEEVRRWVESVIKNPPDYVYYLDGKIITREKVRTLDPSKIKAVNIYTGEQAMAKYGEAAAKGVVLFTTDNQK